MPAVAERDGAFGVAGVLVFDHLFDDAVMGDHPPVSPRIGRPEPQHRRTVRVVKCVKQRPHRRRRYQRHIAVQDQHIAVETGQRGLRLQHRMAGTKLRRLDRDACPARGDGGFDLLSVRANDDDRAFRCQFVQAVQ